MSGPVIDLLNAVDWVVPDLQVAGERVRTLLPALEPTGELYLYEHDFATLFFRGSASMAERPTRIQLVSLPQGGADPTCAVAPFVPMQVAQGLRRRQRVHGTVFAVHNFDDSVAWLRHRGVPLFVEHTCAHLNYLRAWIGWSEDGGDRLDGFDAGLFVEFIPIEAFPRSVATAVDQPLSPTPALAVTGRLHLVADLSAAVAQLEHLGFGTPVQGTDDLLGVDTARWSFAHPGSGDLVLAAPRTAGPAAAELDEQGSGTWLTGVACTDVHVTAEVALAAGAELVVRGPDRYVLSDPQTGIVLDLTAAGAHD
jgi:hypothetical protein